MAARTATKTGDWSDVTVWDGGVSLPGSGDTANSNGFTVTIDQDINLGSGTLINTHASTGRFLVNAARTIVANITATLLPVLEVTTTFASGTVTITGNLQGGSAAFAYALWDQAASPGIIQIIGNVTGGSNSSANGIGKSFTATVNITGNVTGGTSGAGIDTTLGTINLTGNSQGGTNAIGIFGSSGTPTVNILGRAIGGTNSTAYGARNSGTGIFTINMAVGSAGAAGSGAAGVFSSNRLYTRIKGIEYGLNGRIPTDGWFSFDIDVALNQANFIRTDNGALYSLYATFPYTVQIANAVWDSVRASFVTAGSFGKTSEWAGGSTPPTASEIATEVWAYGARSLTSFGTLVADIWAAVTRTLTSSGGASAADVRAEMDANSVKLANLDVAVSTRAAEGEGGGAEAIADAVWESETRTLTRTNRY